MNRSIVLAALIPVFISGLWTALSGEQDTKDLAKELRAVVDANLDAANAKDLDAYMASIHPKSLSFENTRRQMAQLHKTYELSYKVTQYSFVGNDADYAVARVRQETKKKKGPEFRDNEVDTLQVFRKDKDTWKIWTSAVLEVKYFE
jgi:ketosteroid isomerase-like protein